MFVIGSKLDWLYIIIGLYDCEFSFNQYKYKKL